MGNGNTDSETTSTEGEPTIEGTDIFSMENATDRFDPGQSDDPSVDDPARQPAGESDDKIATEDPATTEDPDKDKGSEDDYRFKDHEAAEAGYKNVRSQATRAEMALAQEKKKSDSLEARLNEQKEADAASERDTKLAEFREEGMEKVLAEIDELEPDDDPEYNKKVAKIWASFHGEVSKFEKTIEDAPVDSAASPADAGTGEDSESTAEASAQASTDQEGTPVTETPAAGSQDVAPQHEEVMAYIDKKAMELGGIDPNTEPLWNHYASIVPGKNADDTPLSFDQQIQWTINAIKSKQKADKAEILAEISQPMDRGAPTGGTNPADGEAQPVTLDAALQSADRLRTL